jgi:hypothetical protein
MQSGEDGLSGERSLPGTAILSAVESLWHGEGVVEQQVDDGRQVVIRGDAYVAQLLIRPGHWIGLELSVASGPPMNYEVDSDLYSLSNNEQFAYDVEQEIVAILTSLASGRILVGKWKGKSALLIPVGDETILVTKRRIVATARRLANSATIVREGIFKVLS